jgi:sugar-specific transcriptional regulator TrmB/FixJ family two-component response regulator
MDDGERLGVLETFGISGYQAKAYLALLELGPSQARDVSGRSGVPLGRVYDVLEKLHQRGLAEVMPEAPRRYRAVPFEVCLERELQRHRERIELLEREQESLLEVMAPTGPQNGFERGEYVVVRGRKAMLERVAGLLASVEKDVLMLGTERTPQRLRADGSAAELQARGGRTRLLVPVGPENAQAVRDCLQQGVDVRHLGSLGEPVPAGIYVVIADGQRALLYQHVPDDLSGSKGDDVGLSLDHPDMVRGIQALAESMWALATPAAEVLDQPAKAGASRTSTVLVVDDEPDILQSLHELLEESLPGVRILTAQAAPQGVEVLRQEPVDLIITDYKLPGMNGLEFLEEAGRLAPGVQRILMTAFPDLKVATRAINEASVENFFIKPLEHGRMVEVVRLILRERRAQQMRNRALDRSLQLLRRQIASVSAGAEAPPGELRGSPARGA